MDDVITRYLRYAGHRPGCGDANNGWCNCNFSGELVEIRTEMRADARAWLLARSVRTFGRHDADCAVSVGYCSCGFRSLVDELTG
jgi:hypothetical protein